LHFCLHVLQENSKARRERGGNAAVHQAFSHDL
jgi:hypothetical protein